jgi:hypothetical protein
VAPASDEGAVGGGGGERRGSRAHESAPVEVGDTTRGCRAPGRWRKDLFSSYEMLRNSAVPCSANSTSAAAMPLSTQSLIPFGLRRSRSERRVWSQARRRAGVDARRP